MGLRNDAADWLTLTLTVPVGFVGANTLLGLILAQKEDTYRRWVKGKTIIDVLLRFDDDIQVRSIINPNSAVLYYGDAVTLDTKVNTSIDIAVSGIEEKIEIAVVSKIVNVECILFADH